MLDFMVIALPRSGTTWAANWLTDDRTFCVHDPLWTVHHADLDRTLTRRSRGRLAGISCTAIWRWSDWLQRHPAKKLILHRDPGEVRQSLRSAGLPPLSPGAHRLLSDIEGKHVPWTDLFDRSRAAATWHWLTGGMPFDVERHAELVQMKIQPQLAKVRRDVELNGKLAKELATTPHLETAG